MVLGNVLLPAEKAGMDLLLILKGSNGLEGSYGRRVHPNRVHGLEGFMLHYPYVSLVVEEVVVWDHGKETSVHARFGGGVVVGARVGQGRGRGRAVVERHLFRVYLSTGRVGRKGWRVNLLHV